MSKLKLEHINVMYQKIKAVQDFSLEVENQSFIVLAGPSGCGKTTLLHAIAGFINNVEGDMYIDDIRINEKEPGDRDLAFVFQEAALFPHLSVFDNITFGLRAKDQIQIKQSVQDISDMLGISDLLKRRADTLSGGQKQRVSIARAWIRQPKLFLMDEPLSALDTRLKSQLRIEIAQLYKRQSATFLYVTHDQMEAMTLADILIIMKDGKIQQIGKPLDIYHHPNNLFTASFLGKMALNIFEGHIREHTLYCKDRRLPLSKQIEDGDYIIALRCEHIYVENEYGMQGEVVLVENAGDELYYHIQWDKQTMIMKGGPHQLYNIGDRISFSFHWRDVMLFDKKTKQSVNII